MDEDKKQNEQEMVPKQELEACAKERDEYLAGWQRAKADFINHKKDEARRIEELAKYQNEDIIRDLITVMDNFDLGLEALSKQGPVEKGIYMIRAQIEDILRQRGLKRISMKPGDAYDPSVAETITEEDPPAGGPEYPPGSILEVIEPGYKLFDKVIRCARVKLVKQLKTDN